MAYTLRTEDHAGELGRAADQNESVNNDIYFNTFGQWDDWVPVIVGYSADPANAIYRYTTIGKTVILAMTEGTAGTSDSVNLNYTLPIAAKTLANHGWGGVIPTAVDNGSAVFNVIWDIDQAGTVVSLWKYGGAAWTASGGKAGFTHGSIIIYEID